MSFKEWIKYYLFLLIGIVCDVIGFIIMIIMDVVIFKSDIGTVFLVMSIISFVFVGLGIMFIFIFTKVKSK